MYGFLISQTDLDHSGIISWRPARWALDLNEPEEDVRAWLKELEQAKFVVIDEEWQELLVRSLIRRDEIWKLPNVFKAAAGSATASKSRRIKGALYGEVRRIDFSGTRHETQALARELLTVLEPFSNPSGTDPEPSRRGSETAAQWLPDGSGNGSGRVPGQHEARTGGKPRVSAGDTGPGIVSERSGEPLRRPYGVGEGNGPVVVGVPTPSPSPSTVVPTEPARPLWPSPVPDARPEGEGDQSGNEDQDDLAALVAEVRKIRPSWSTRSIRRALADESVAERPWLLVRSAMLAIARDRASEHPGRLAHDGPWWRAECAPSAPVRSPWCGSCNEQTRMREADDGRPYHCPECHPKALEAS
jgi:hypothetical protein